MEQASSMILGGIISSVLPIEDNMIKLQLGIILSGIFSTLMKKLEYLNILRFFSGRKNKLSISNRYESRINPIYYQVEEYFIKKYVHEFQNLQLVPKNGDISFSADKQEFNQPIYDQYNDHQIRLEVGNNTNKKDGEMGKGGESSNIINISSDTASLDLLKQYTENICNIAKPDTSIITIYKIRLIESEKSSFVDWETVYIKTNKSYKNTIVSEEIEEDLFNDIDKFCKNEEWYSTKGIPYKRGYVLHGPPGTGKTSIIKAIANHHQIPIFNLDLSSIKNNTDMLKLVTEINYLAKNKKYMVTIEDVDRSPLFNNTNNWEDRRRLLENSKLTIDCLLNVLDGIIETHGRIFIMTANNINVFDNLKEVLFRPGRIDKQLNITYCNNKQISKIVSNFYDIDEEEVYDVLDTLELNKVTPAVVMKYLQDNPDDVEILYQKLTRKKNSVMLNNEDIDEDCDGGGIIPYGKSRKKPSITSLEGITIRINEVKKEKSSLKVRKRRCIKILEQRQKQLQRYCQKEEKLTEQSQKLSVRLSNWKKKKK